MDCLMDCLGYELTDYGQDDVRFSAPDDILLSFERSWDPMEQARWN